MKFHRQILLISFSAAFLIASTLESGAFALLGPFQPWMQATNGVILPGDIGGPMCLSNGYRWNVPVITYGFDQSFLDFFGSNGVTAVEGAIAILNNLPSASSNALTNYLFGTRRINYTANSQSLFDLKSVTLPALLEQMGLANPKRYIYVLRQWNPVFIYLSSDGVWPPGTIPTYIVQRNFDPLALAASSYVNDALFGGVVSIRGSQSSIVLYAADPVSAAEDPSVASFELSLGAFYLGLTYDDVGGLAYLLSTNNINFETLLPDIVSAERHHHSFVNGAWRPGVDKITFVPQPVDSRSGRFRRTTYYFTDHYLTNGTFQEQRLARIISKPDIIFSAGDLGSSAPTVPLFTRTGTTNWLNNAAANGNTNGAGPGVIQPQVNIVFNKLGPILYTYSDQPGSSFFDTSEFYGSFDGTTNSPVVYPASQATTNQSILRMWLLKETSQFSSTNSFEWKLAGATGAQFNLQTSTDLAGWTNLFTVTNNGCVSTYLNYNPTAPGRFYRLVPQ